jgi:hypothetical protein
MACNFFGGKTVCLFSFPLLRFFKPPFANARIKNYNPFLPNQHPLGGHVTVLM